MEWRQFIRVSFVGSDLSRGEFSQEQWRQCVWHKVNLTHVDLDGVDIRYVDFTGVQICDWQQEQLLNQLGIVVLS